ncbi:MAG: L-seryl-tRNA(Sec) selenium transferase [Nitrospirae bacterium RBG_16_64_22]|nr:MAG: L-seryl-tRNA(Sec) selenium transferase [Nitrospirae bacterium RBG_16_64_22]
MQSRETLLRRIPAVDEMLRRPAVEAWSKTHPHAVLVEAIRGVLADLRERILAGEDLRPEDLDPAGLLPRVEARLIDLLRPSLRRVLNATGVVVHTNLGRSPLPAEAVEAVRRVAEGYSNLEYDVARGERGKRFVHVEGLLRDLTGAEAATVVNNNAAAVLLVLNALAEGKEVVVSRGELIEIGGSFRIPDVMARSGARLREVGTTNKTRLADYEEAVGPDTALLLKVHTSNFAIVGFTEDVPVSDLSGLGRGRGIPVVHDLGSGSFVDLAQIGIGPEPTVGASLKSGADVVTFSGDKLLGGPQAGIIVGKRNLLDRIRSNPLARAVRIDKLTLAALEAVLRIYRDEPEGAAKKIPVLSMLTAAPADLKRRAQKLAEMIRKEAGDRAAVSVQPEQSQAGGGALPLGNLPTWAASVLPADVSVSRVEALLRENDPPVIARVKEGCVLFDPRTLRDADFPVVALAVGRALGKTAAEAGK